MTSFYPEIPLGAKEEWVPVKGAPHYEISNYGRIMSYIVKRPRCNLTVVDVPQRMMKWIIMTNGYPSVRLVKLNGKNIAATIHSLVAEHFIGPRPHGMQVRHLDGNRMNPHVSNLAYGTVQDNADDARRHGTIPYGEQKLLAKKFTKLTNKLVEQIRQECYDNPNTTYEEIGKKYGIAGNRVSSIASHNTWKRVGGPQSLRSNTILTIDKAREIRRIYNLGNITYLQLGQLFGVSEATVGQVIRKDTWKEEV